MIPHCTLLEAICEFHNDYVSWPSKPLLLFPGLTQRKYQSYPKNVISVLKEYIPFDSSSNDPAICVFFLAGGKRPLFETGKEWNIHHIYDGKFPYSGRQQTTYAIKDGKYFTQAAGLVALHPLAEIVAATTAEFAWWLRREAFERFGFDPDNVFAGRH